jgi:hypothetical protein
VAGSANVEGLLPGGDVLGHGGFGQCGCEGCARDQPRPYHGSVYHLLYPLFSVLTSSGAQPDPAESRWARFVGGSPHVRDPIPGEVDERGRGPPLRRIPRAAELRVVIV